jgi:putative spermidine/putrescine transport system ATP-binding protein
MNGSSIQLNAATVVFGNRRALDGVTLEVAAGERLAIVGESGAGKSTLLNAIAGLIELTHGVVRIGEKDVSGLDPTERSVGLLFQSDALFPHMTAFENVAFPLRAQKWKDDQVRERAAALIAQVGLHGFENALPRNLSGGERQRVALARALALRPSILLFDEPFANLDVPLRRRLRETLLKIQGEERFTLVLVSHDPDEAAQIGERIAVLHKGQLVAADTGRMLYWHPPSAYVAQLFGPCNELPARITRSDDSIQLQLLGSSIPSPALPSNLCAPADASLLVRPEAIRLSRSGQPETGVWRGRVTSTHDLGRVWSIRFSVDGLRTPVEAHIQINGVNPLPEIGDLITWTIDAGRVHCLQPAPAKEAGKT